MGKFYDNKDAEQFRRERDEAGALLQTQVEIADAYHAEYRQECDPSGACCRYAVITNDARAFLSRLDGKAVR